MSKNSVNRDHVVLMGTKGGPTIRPGSTMPTSSLLFLEGKYYIVDCGLGVSRGLIDSGFQLRDLATIFITHLHSDHYLELGPLLHTAWTAGLKSPVNIWGPKGLDVYWESFLSSMKSDIELRIDDEGRPDLRKLIAINVIEEGEFLKTDKISVTAIRNEHPPLIDTFALSFRSPRRKVVFSGDTAYLPALADFASGADLLIHEAMLEEALESLLERIGNGDERLMKHWLRSHTLASDAAKIASTAKVKTLALHHLIPSDDPDYSHRNWTDVAKPHFGGKLFIGEDGLKIELEK
ncbi:MAG: MBL fold metallo-hydrolase [Hyphomicrobiales bacterium]|nr:MBL fold metallo-hydrolase [Hyphomicrobiales bacterium]